MFILLYFSTPHACTLHHVCYTISNIRLVICLAMPFLNRIPLASIQHRSAGLIDLKESTWSNVRSAYLARTLRNTVEQAVWICFASGTILTHRLGDFNFELTCPPVVKSVFEFRWVQFLGTCLHINDLPQKFVTLMCSDGTVLNFTNLCTSVY